MKLYEFLETIVENSERYMDITDLEQNQHPYSKFPYKKYFAALGKKELAEYLLKAIKKPALRYKKTPYYMSNTRLVVFTVEESNELVYRFYNPDYDIKDYNSHRKLTDMTASSLGDGRYLSYQRRLCCFYSVIMGNRYTPTLILYGESCDYPHTRHTKELLDAFIEKFKKENEDYKVIDLISPTIENIEWPEENDEDDDW